MEAVATEYRDAGFEVVMLPDDTQLPIFLHGTHPDLLAQSLEENVVVEIKAIRDLRGSEDVSELARRVTNHPGWRFELITIRTPKADVSERPRWDNRMAKARLDEAKKLAGSGHTEAAYLLGYAAVEAILFSWALSWGGVSAKQHTALAIAKRMVVSGALSHRDLVRFESLSNKRNAVAHGIAGTKLLASDVRTLLALGERALRAPLG